MRRTTARILVSSAVALLLAPLAVLDAGEIPREFRILFKHLPDAQYLVTIGDQEQKHAAAELVQGLELTLKPAEHIRISVRHSEHRALQQQFQQQRSAHNALSHACQLLQQRAIQGGPAAASSQHLHAFTEALSACLGGRHADAYATAAAIVRDVRTQLKAEP